MQDGGLGRHGQYLVVLVLEGLGKGVMVYLHLSDGHALVGRDCYEGGQGEWDGGGGHGLVRRDDDDLQHVFVHGV